MVNLTILNLHKNIPEFYERLKLAQVSNVVISTLGSFLMKSEWKKIYTFILISHSEPVSKVPSLLDLFNYTETYKKSVYNFLTYEGKDKVTKNADIFANKIMDKVKPGKDTYYFNLFNSMVKLVSICGITKPEVLGENIVDLFHIAKQVKPFVKKEGINELEIYVYFKQNLNKIKRVLFGSYHDLKNIYPILIEEKQKQLDEIDVDLFL